MKMGRRRLLRQEILKLKNLLRLWLKRRKLWIRRLWKLIYAHPKSPKDVARDPEKGKSAQEDPVTIFPTSASAPVNVERSLAGDQGSFSYDAENSSICPEETPEDYYYKTYSGKKAF
ncbi:hypothetical protein Hanom_Chr12g01138771 [Helianthus anomalus]